MFSKVANIYNYGMTCHDILIGKLPFEGHVESDSDVIKGGCLVVPKYVED